VDIGALWNLIIVEPMINSLVLLYAIFFGSFGLAIIAFTVLVRLAMFPLTLKQSRQMRAMSALSPKMKEIQERYAGDKGRASRETMKLYKDHGVNPLGCLGPMVLQMPIFFGLFWALRGTLPSTPESLANLADKLYPWLPWVHGAVPLDSGFLTMDLARYSSDNPVPFNVLLPVLVGGSMWAMQKMTPSASTSSQQESTQKMLLWMMPIMFGFLTLSFEAGLALYWIVSSVVGIVMQGFVTGWGPLTNIVPFGRTAEPVPAPALPSPAEEVEAHEDDRNDRKNVRRSDRNRAKGARGRARGRRNRRR
jgi:YidC/Oxa1 family membrane protein insertase